MELSLGQIRNVADVTLNGKPLGILWKPPYVCDVTGVVRSGKNELKVEITNLWANRLVGDAKLPREKRVTRITQQVPIQGPHESGLFGPVQLLNVPCPKQEVSGWERVEIGTARRLPVRGSDARRGHLLYRKKQDLRSRRHMVPVMGVG